MSATDCLHTRTVLDNSSEICTLCGLVIDQQILSSENNRILPDRIYRTSRNVTRRVKDDAERGHSIIADICANHHVLKCIELTARDLYADKHASRTESAAVRVALCLFTSFSIHDSPRGIDEVAGMCHVPAPSLYKIITDVEEPHTISRLKPSSLSARVFPYLDFLTFSHRRKINSTADYIYEHCQISSPPRTILAVVLYARCRRFFPKNKHSTLAHLSRVCGVSTTCLKRLAKHREIEQHL